MSQQPTLAVVGGGAAGTSLIAAYARRLSSEIGGTAADVIVFESAQRYGPGVAYAQDADTALLNRPYSAMSVDYGDPGQFRRWLYRRRSAAAPAPTRTSLRPAPAGHFVPRNLFGNYLEDVFRQACEDLALLGARVTLVPTAVTDIVTDGTAGRLLVTADGQRHAADVTVLAVGTLPPADVFGLRGTDGFVHQPYPLDRSLDGIGADRDVLVLGSGLTAVDVALVLAGHGHRAGITLASRSGRVPDVRTDLASSPLPELLSDARQLLARGDVTLRGVHHILDSALRAGGTTLAEALLPYTEDWDAPDLLRHRLADPLPGGLAQRCVGALAPYYSALWRALPATQQRAFLRSRHRTYNCLRSPMPTTNAQKLLALGDSGQLTFRRRITAVEPAPGGGFTATYADGTTTRHDVVVNAVGRTIDTSAAPPSSLVSRLVARGTVVPHPLGGVRVDPATNQVLDAGGGVREGLYVVGDLASGEHFHTSSMELVARQADTVAGRLVPASDRVLAGAAQ
ncbi:FAD/NAD(P)-binding protein [Streptomyces sp. NPDC057386]|uniref:FAD/NAD(P)-binding protein n=1 Tax=Streptomyces thermocoprophilus TaxID=78356 RepID=A0ABV5VD02_9ACTN